MDQLLFLKRANEEILRTHFWEFWISWLLFIFVNQIFLRIHFIGPDRNNRNYGKIFLFGSRKLGRFDAVFDPIFLWSLQWEISAIFFTFQMCISWRASQKSDFHTTDISLSGLFFKKADVFAITFNINQPFDRPFLTTNNTLLSLKHHF